MLGCLLHATAAVPKMLEELYSTSAGIAIVRSLGWHDSGALAASKKSNHWYRFQLHQAEQFLLGLFKKPSPQKGLADPGPWVGSSVLEPGNINGSSPDQSRSLVPLNIGRCDIIYNQHGPRF